MRVLVITSSYPRHRFDSAGIFVEEQASALAARGHEVLVLAPGASGVAEYTEGALCVHRPRPLLPSLSDGIFYGAGVPDNLAAAPWRGGALPLALGPFMQCALQLSHRVDVVLSHWLLPSGLLGAFVAERRGIGHVATAHSGEVHLLGRLPPSVASLFASWLVARTGHVFCSGGHIRAKLARLIAPHRHGRLQVQPMGLHVADYARRTPYVPPAVGAPLRVLAVARLVPVKGLDVLVEAAAHAAREAPRPIELTIAGEGPERARLAALARARKVTLDLVGAVAPAEVPALLAAHHLFALPSRVLPSGRTEGCPRTLMEAFAAGLPVVVSDLPEVGEMVAAAGAGLIAPPDSPVKLGARLCEAAGSPAALAGWSAAAEKAAAAHDWSVTMERLINALTSNG